MKKRSTMHLMVCLSLYCILTLGCSTTIQSKGIANPDLNKRQPVSGTRYALPLRLLKFQIWEAELLSSGNGPCPEPIHFARLDVDGSRYIPDPAAQFILSYQGSGLSSDEVTWEVTPDGFLKKVETKFSDQTGEILKAAASLVLEVAKIQAVGLIPPSPPGAKLKKDTMTMIEEFEVDPLSQSGKKRFCEVKQSYGITITVTALNGHDPCPKNDCPEVNQEIKGVAYRATYPYKVDIQRAARQVDRNASDDTQCRYSSERYEQIVLLPNKSPVTVIPITPAAFVEKETKLTFQDGNLTSVTVTKPSQLLGFFKVLLEPVRLVGSLPGEILAAQLRQTKGQAEIVAQETALLNSMTSYLEALEKYRNRRLAGRNAPPAQ